MTKPPQKPYLGTFYDWTSRCGQHRSHGKHDRCSKRRQALKRQEQGVPHGV